MSTSGPRAVFTRIACGFIRRSCGSPISPTVSGPSGACSETKSERSSSSSSGTPPPREVWITSIPNPSARRATAEPIRPIPTMPSVAPLNSSPSRKSGSQLQPPPRIARSASGSRRAALSISAHARSAVASVSTPGVLPTGTPRSLAAARSTLSTPTA